MHAAGRMAGNTDDALTTVRARTTKSPAGRQVSSPRPHSHSAGRFPEHSMYHQAIDARANTVASPRRGAGQLYAQQRGDHDLNAHPTRRRSSGCTFISRWVYSAQSWPPVQKPVHWMGSSKEDLLKLPGKVVGRWVMRSASPSSATAPGGKPWRGRRPRRVRDRRKASMAIPTARLGGPLRFDGSKRGSGVLFCVARSFPKTGFPTFRNAL